METESAMKRSGTSLALIALAVVVGGAALAGGIYVRGRLEARSPELITLKPTATELGVAVTRPDFSLPDQHGTMRSISEWNGKLLLVNFWATWCPPCLHEIPVFMELQEFYVSRGVQFLGIAIDSVENVREFANRVELNYPTLHGQLEAIEVARAFGNATGGLPFTALIDRQGNIVARHVGPLDETQARELLEKFL